VADLEVAALVLLVVVSVSVVTASVRSILCWSGRVKRGHRLASLMR